MGESKVPAKIDREGLLAVQLLKDSFFVAVGGATLVAIVSGGGFLGAAVHVSIASIAIFLTAIFVQAIFNTSRETLVRKLMGWASISGLLYLAYVAWLGEIAIYFSVSAFVFTTVHTLLLHPRQDAEFRSEEAEKAGNRLLAERLAIAAQSPDAKPLPRSIDRGLAELPADIDPEIRELLDSAVEDYAHLHEIVSDPTLASNLGRDDTALLHGAEAVLLDVLKRAPLVSRVKRLASRRDDDPNGQAAADAAQARLRRQTDALHDAASAALQLAASEGTDAAEELREHIDGLNALREARDEIERDLAAD